VIGTSSHWNGVNGKNLNINVGTIHKQYSENTTENSDRATITGFSSDYYNNHFVTFEVYTSGIAKWSS